MNPRRKPILFGVYYRPPSPSVGFLKLRESLAILPPAHHVLLCGDFNVPHIDWNTVSLQASPNSLAQELCDLTNDFALEQLVSEPTRNENILDLVFSNEPLQASNVHVVNGLVGSDHHI